jgi:predicted nucleic acid-binding Zn ribbon protein
MKRSNLVHIGAALEKLISESPLQDRMLQHRIKSNWAACAGSLIAQHTQKLWFVRQTLYVEVNSDALKHELQYHRSTLIKNINQQIGQSYIHEIKIV